MFSVPCSFVCRLSLTVADCFGKHYARCDSDKWHQKSVWGAYFSVLMTWVWNKHARFKILELAEPNSTEPDEAVIYRESLDMMTMMWFVASVFLHSQMYKIEWEVLSEQPVLPGWGEKMTTKQMVSSVIRVSDDIIMIPPPPNIFKTLCCLCYEDDGGLGKCADKMWTFLDYPNVSFFLV